MINYLQPKAIWSYLIEHFEIKLDMKVIYIKINSLKVIVVQ